MSSFQEQRRSAGVAGSEGATPENRTRRRDGKADLLPGTIETLTEYAEGTKKTGSPWSIMFEELARLGVIGMRRRAGRPDWNLIEIHNGVQELLREHGCFISGPYDGYYLIDMRDRPPRWPYRVLISMPAAEFLPAERGYSTWLDERSATFRIDSLPEFGFVQASMTDRTLAEAFVAAHGGSLLTNQEVGNLLYGGEPVKASFIRRSRRREACATSTATPAM